jgi:hypothetical protein
MKKLTSFFLSAILFITAANAQDGKVGVNTTAPTATIDVNGNARVRELPAGSLSDLLVTSDVNGNLRKLPITEFRGPYFVGARIITTSAPVLSTDYVLIVKASGVAITLPSASANAGRVLKIKVSKISSADVIISPTGSDFIDATSSVSTGSGGAPNGAIKITNGNAVELVSDGVDTWDIVGTAN